MSKKRIISSYQHSMEFKQGFRTAPFYLFLSPPKKGKNRRVLITSDSSYHWRNIRI